MGFYIWGMVVPQYMRKNYSDGKLSVTKYERNRYDNNAVYQYSL
jgi:hypothetical protein